MEAMKLKTIVLMSICSLASAYPGFSNGNSLDAGKVPTTQSIETRPVPVPVYEQVPVDIPSPIPVAKPTYVNVPIPQPYPVHVTVDHPIEVPVYTVKHEIIEKRVPYTVEEPYPVEVEKPYPVEVVKRIEIPVPHPYKVPVTIYKHVLQTHSSHGHGHHH